MKRHQCEETLSMFDVPATETTGASHFRDPGPAVKRSSRASAAPKTVVPVPGINIGQMGINIGAMPTLDAEKTRQAAAEGIAHADAGASVQWKAHASQCILAVARQKPEFTTDDVYQYMVEAYKDFDFTDPGQNKSKLGPAMQRAAERGWCVRIVGGVISQRPSSHGRNLRVWKSLLFGQDI